MKREVSMKLLLIVALIAVAPVLAAQLEIGDPVPDHHVDFWINPAPYNQFSDFEGDVVIFKKWGLG
jgi:hypothetical protein